MDERNGQIFTRMCDLGDAADHVQALGDILVTTLTEDEERVFAEWVEEMRSQEKQERP